MFSRRAVLWTMALALAGSVWADAGNVLVAFSSLGPDKYADGTTVRDGEWYALCWSKNAEFGGFTTTGEPAVAGDQVVLKASLATNGCCPTVVFQVDSKVAATLNGGKYAVYMMDTRGVNGVPSQAGASGGPAMINGSVPVSAKIFASAQTQTTVSSVATEVDAWGESEADPDTVGQPKITGFAVKGARAQFKVTGMHPSVKYTIHAGETPAAMSSTDLTPPISDETNDVFFDVDAQDFKFFKIGRAPLK